MKMAHEELRKYQVKNKRLYDCKAKKRVFRVGDKVLILLPTDNSKLLMQWRGPYTVKGCQGGDNYQIEVNRKTRNYHINMLKGIRTMTLRGPRKVVPRGSQGLIRA